MWELLFYLVDYVYLLDCNAPTAIGPSVNHTRVYACCLAFGGRCGGCVDMHAFLCEEGSVGASSVYQAPFSLAPYPPQSFTAPTHRRQASPRPPTRCCTPRPSASIWPRKGWPCSFCGCTAPSPTPSTLTPCKRWVSPSPGPSLSIYCHCARVDRAPLIHPITIPGRTFNDCRP